MPKDYEILLEELRRMHPDWPESRLKEMAARMTNARRKKEGRPPAKFHRDDGGEVEYP